MSANPLTNIPFNESEVLRASRLSVDANCVPTALQVFYNDEHALTLGVRQVNVKTAAGTTTTNYAVSPLVTDPGSAMPPLVGSMIPSGDQAGTDVSGRPLFPALFITDLTTNPGNPYAGDWQYGGTAIAPSAVFGTWKAAVRTVDKTRNPNTVTVTPDGDPAKNNYNLGPGSDPVPAGLVNQGYGAEVRWDLSTLNLTPGHQYRLYFMVHDGDQNKTGGDVGQDCAIFTQPGTAPTPTPSPTPTATPVSTPTPTPSASPTPGCGALTDCTPPYPFVSANPLTNIPFNESEVLRASRLSVDANCVPTALQVFYNDEHALTLGVREVKVKTAAGTTTTDYAVSPLTTDPGSAMPPLVGSTIPSGDQAGTDVSGRPLYPALFLTDLTTNPGNPYAGDWQYGGTAIAPSAVFGTWKAAVRTVDKTKNPNVVTVTPDGDPAKNNYNLGPGSDPVPAGLVNQGYGAEVRWDLSTLNLTPGHQYRLYFMVHDGDQNKTGGDVGQDCAIFNY